MPRKWAVAVPVLVLANLALGADQADTLMEAGHWKRARALVQPEVKTNPSDAHALSSLARIEWAFGDEAGLKLAEKAVALDPRNADGHFYLAEILGEMARTAGPLRSFGLARRFRSELAVTLALKPDHTFALFAQMLFYWEAPGIAGGDKKKAAATAEEIAKYEPARGNFARARLAALQNDPTAQAAYDLKAIEINPRYYTVLIELAALKNDEKYARAAQRVDEGRAGAYIALAAIYAASHRWAELDSVLRESEANLPDDFTPFYRAASILIDQNAEPSRAAQYLSKYLSQEPEAKEPTRAQAQRLMQRLKQAPPGRPHAAIRSVALPMGRFAPHEGPEAALP